MPPRLYSPRGFSLVELLVAIAVMAILGLILIQTTASVSQRADDTQCRVALRQWGVAVQLYATDHDGVLPGPCYSNILPTQIGENHRHLFAYLAPYIDLTNSSPGRLPENYYCPGWLQEATDKNAPVYYLPNRVVVTNEDGTTLRPFGSTGDNSEGMGLWHLQSVVDPGSVVVMSDIDRLMLSSSAEASYGSKVPQGPVHGNHRNVLFFDWSVGTQEVPR